MMTILQALKKIKHLDRKIGKSQERIGKWCSYISPIEEPQYDTNKLIQTVNDLLSERAKLRHALHVTNALHKVEFKGKEITVDELLILSTVTIPQQIETLRMLRRKEKPYHLQGKDAPECKVVLQYDPAGRDRQIDALENDLDIIDQILDEINITTDISSYVK